MHALRSSLAALVLVALATASPAVAAKKKPPARPDLTVSTVGPVTPSVPSGGSFALASTVRNAGKAKAKASALRVYLAADARRRGERGMAGKRVVPALKARKTSAGTATFTVPASVPAATYLVFVCADADRKVRESKEKNNCRAAASRITVAASGGLQGQGGQPNAGGETSGTSTASAGGETSGGGGTGGPGGGDPPGGDAPVNPDRDGDGTPNAQDCAPDDAAVHPGAEDRPDGGSADANCDGKDGDRADAIHVREAGGVDDVTCGLATAPCRSIRFAVSQATTFGREQVYVGPGTYDGSVRLTQPVSIYGGWDASWDRSLAVKPTLRGASDVNAGTGFSAEAIAVLVEAPAELADLTITGANAVGTESGGAGKSSYGIFVRNAGAPGVALRRLQVRAGDGTDGADGADASNTIATVVTAMHGSAGANAGLSTGTGDPVCNEEFSQGGQGGSSNFGGTAGTGGRGGREDRNCAAANPNFVPEDGQSGGTIGAALGGAGGQAGWTGNRAGYPAGFPNGRSCGPGSPGNPGTVQHGAPGTTAIGGRVDNTPRLWAGGSGGAGTLGQNGGNGAGGGGAGACEVDDGAFHGGGGGGGGAGGARNSGPAPFNTGAGGGAGRGAGGSFPVYIVGSAVTIDVAMLTRGTGGTGGDGGDGGTGGAAGIGGAGGTDVNFNNPLLRGGRGGDGGWGGSSGPGAGGAGGASVGIYLAAGTSSLSGGATATITGGGAGAGGAGGAGDAPVANAQAGPAGTHAALGQCAAVAAC